MVNGFKEVLHLYLSEKKKKKPANLKYTLARQRYILLLPEQPPKE